MNLAELKNQVATPEARLPVIKAGFFDMQSFELLQRTAKAFAQSDLVPKQYQGNLANCMIAMDMAQRIGANPLMCMQNLYVVHGTPGWSSKFLIATVNTCGRYSAMRYEWKGEPGKPDFGCRAWAIERETGERLNGVWVTWEMVRSEGWDAKNGSKWKTMPDQMFVYRSASFWTRAYAPELSMGLQTADEIEDVFDANQDSSGRYVVSTDDLRQGPPSSNESPQVTQATEAELVDVQKVSPTTAPATEPKQSRLSPEEIAAIQAQEQAELLAQGQSENQPEQRTTRARSERKPMNLE